MKKILLASLPVFLTASFLSAQVSITYATHGISVGNVFNYFTADTTGVHPGSSGTAQTWNFSSLNVGTTLATTTYVTPASTPYAASFSGSNLATNDGSGQYAYFNGNTSSIAITGAANSQTTIPYSNSELYMNYPFAYSNTATDNFYSAYTSNSFSVIRSGTVTITADGSGTLVLPSGSTNVLRVKVVQLFSDSFVGFYSAQYNYVSYYWYSAGQKFPLMSFNQLSTTILSNSSYAESILINSVVAGIEESPSTIGGINLFPNPANENAHLNFSVNESQQINIQVSDLEGKTILDINRGELSAGEYNENIDVSTFAKGIYSVKVQGEKSFASTKLVVE